MVESLNPKSQRGAILPVVLWTVAMISLIAASVSANVRRDARSASVETDLLRSQVLVEGTIDLAAALLIAKDKSASLISRGSVIRSEISDAPVEIRIQETSGLADINRTDPILLERLASGVTGSEYFGKSLAGAIVQLRALKKPAPDAEGEKVVPAFQSTVQLYALDGVDADGIAAVLPFLSTQSPDGKINLRTAPRQVLEAIPGATAGDVAKFVRARDSANGDEKAWPEDITRKWEPFSSRGEGNIYKVSGVIRGGDRVISGTRVTATIRLDNQSDTPYRVLSWSW